MPFGLWARMGRRNHLLDGVQRYWGTLPWQPILGLKLLLTGFVWTTATRQLVMKGVWVVGQQNAGIVPYCRYHAPKGRCRGNHFWFSIYGVHIGATWRIRLNCPCAAAMRPYVELLGPLVVIIITQTLLSIHYFSRHFDSCIFLSRTFIVPTHIWAVFLYLFKHFVAHSKAELHTHKYTIQKIYYRWLKGGIQPPLT